MVNQNQAKEGSYVVVVDDDVMERELIRQVLKRAGITVAIEEHEDGEGVIEAMSRYAVHPPSVIILDINMPKVTGLEVLEHFQNDQVLSAIPVIIFSTSDSEKDKEKSLGLGTLHYIVKPTDLDDYAMLVEAVREQIEKRTSL